MACCLVQHNDTWSVQRGAFCQFNFWWVYYCHKSKSIGKQTFEMHLCAVTYYQSPKLIFIYAIDRIIHVSIVLEKALKQERKCFNLKGCKGEDENTKIHDSLQWQQKTKSYLVPSIATKNQQNKWRSGLERQQLRAHEAACSLKSHF